MKRMMTILATGGLVMISATGLTLAGGTHGTGGTEQLAQDQSVSDRRRHAAIQVLGAMKSAAAAAVDPLEKMVQEDSDGHQFRTMYAAGAIEKITGKYHPKAAHMD